VTFARSEGIIAAPESSHAINAAIDEARKADQAGKEQVILFNLSGHGFFDMAAYDAYFSGKLVDFEYPREAVEKSMARLPNVQL
jgi:tryptophan synthase beta chain